MRRRAWRWIWATAFLLQGGFAKAQSSLDALEQELNEARQQHQEVTTQVLSNFFNQIDAAMGSPDAAISLYQQAGGKIPAPSPIITEHEDETATERESRLAQDQANLSAMGALVQLHCGLLHYAALFITKPDQKGLSDEWITWLQRAAQTYPQLGVVAERNDQKLGEPRRKKDKPDGTPTSPPFNSMDLKGQTMRDSTIGKFLGFKSWADKEQGTWAVQEVPQLYRAAVLEPLRTSPSSATLAAWDVYIAMMSADEKDNEKWNQVDFPPLQFERACDDYTVGPGTEKLEVLVNLIKANPTYPQVDDWIARVHQMVINYRIHHGGRTAAAQIPLQSSSSGGDPNVIVTTTRQGDMTIVTTHTNSTPVNPVPGH